MYTIRIDGQWIERLFLFGYSLTESTDPLDHVNFDLLGLTSFLLEWADSLTSRKVIIDTV